MPDRDKDGFTLVEALVALAVLGVTLVGALEVTSRTLRVQAAAERHLEAVALANAKLNQLATLPVDSLASYQTRRTGNVRLGGHRYAWQALARRDSSDFALWEAAVRVEWGEGEFTAETAFYRREPDRLRGAGYSP